MNERKLLLKSIKLQDEVNEKFQIRDEESFLGFILKLIPFIVIGYVIGIIF